MKVFIVVALMLSSISALDQVSNLKTQVGEACDSTGYVTILEFDVEPWIPVEATSSVITIQATINQPNMGVGTISFGTENKLQQWTYEYLPVNQRFNQGTEQTFQYVLYWPTLPGNYITQVTIGGIDIPVSINACWTFSFSLGTGMNITFD
ncbi:hypothetical protein SteCoe_38107 [Stentor coeruleus]|uniref:MD-2-related lipid-recognition domain-containing protein n=1 Tax=Stentor coeruleus TaxID=5963 RepID=A0A1R2ALX1_9CILI|nr:hypothetical protein SteCoe_38107 [Stentor coeruleus]